MFGFGVRKIDFDIIGSVKLILAKIDSILEAESILLLGNQTSQNQFYTFKINSICSRIETKHTLNYVKQSI
jgi:hypothetical protein